MMKKIRWLVLLLIGLAFISVPIGYAHEIDPLADLEKTKLTKNQEQRLAWWSEAKFGMFIHWGLYASLSGEWEGKQYHGWGEWIMKDARIPIRKYEKVAQTFNPTRFNAEEWVKLAKDAGMRYIVITTKHHDGFCLFDSKVNDYNIVKTTPWKHDPIKELSQACRKQGITFCLYYSLTEWHHPDGTNDWDYTDMSKKDTTRWIREKAIPQVKELLTKYGPIGLLWFDNGPISLEQSNELAAMVHELQPECIINDRLSVPGDYVTPEEVIPAVEKRGPFEVCMTMNDTWGYKNAKAMAFQGTRWKTAPELIHKLVDIAGKGGNYLLNIGPDGDGVIPAPSVKILREVGQWMKENGDSICGTRGSPLGILPWGRCTAKPGKLYLHIFNWPHSNRLMVPGLKNKVTKTYLLTKTDNKLLKFTRINSEDLLVNLPDQAPNQIDTVFVIEFEGTADINPLPLLTNEYENVFRAYSAKIHGKTAKYFDWSREMDQISRWSDPEDWVSWQFKIVEAGSFDVEITYACPRGAEGSMYIVTVGDKAISSKVNSTGGSRSFKAMKIGTINLSRPGTFTLSIKPNTIANTLLMELRSLTLVPKNEKSEAATSTL